MRKKVTELTLLLLFVNLVSCRRPNEFERLHREGLSKNPEGVALHLSTEDGRSEYKQGEVAKIVLSFTSTETAKYRAELKTGWNPASVTDEFSIEYPDGSIHNVHANRAFACCETSHPFIGGSPQLATAFGGFSGATPGKYRVFIQTRRVSASKGDHEPWHYEVSPLMTTSDVLSLQVR